MTYESIFRGQPIFARAGKEVIVKLVSSLSLAHYAPGDVLIRQGKLDTVLYIIAHGSLQVLSLQAALNCSLAAALGPQGSCAHWQNGETCSHVNCDQGWHGSDSGQSW